MIKCPYCKMEFSANKTDETTEFCPYCHRKIPFSKQWSIKGIFQRLLGAHTDQSQNTEFDSFAQQMMPGYNPARGTSNFWKWLCIALIIAFAISQGIDFLKDKRLQLPILDKVLLGAKSLKTNPDQSAANSSTVEMEQRRKAQAEQAAQAEKARQEQLAQAEREHQRMQKERAQYLVEKLDSIANTPAELVEVPTFLTSHIKYIKWISPTEELIAAKTAGNTLQAYNLIAKSRNRLAKAVDELPDEAEIDKAWNKFITSGENLNFVIQFHNVNDIGMRYSPKCMVDERSSVKAAGIRFTKAGVYRKSAGVGDGGFICKLSAHNLNRKWWMLLDEDADSLSKQASGFADENDAEEFKANVEKIAAEATRIIARYNGQELKGETVNGAKNATAVKPTSLTPKEIAATKKFAEAEVAKLDFKLPHYLMIHRLINKYRSFLQVQESKYAEYTSMKESGQYLELLKLFNNERDVLTSNDVIRAIAELKSTKFHFEIEFDCEHNDFGNPIIVKIDPNLGLTSYYFNGTVPFCVGGPKSYIIEEGALNYFQRYLMTLPDETSMRKALEERLAKDITYDADLRRQQREMARAAAEAAEEERRRAEEARRQSEELNRMVYAERRREAARRRAERKRLHREKWSLKGPGGRIIE